MIDTLKTFLERNPATVVALALAACLVVGFTGCAATITSPISGESVTRAEYAVEVGTARSDIERRAKQVEADAAALAAKVDAADAEFERVEGVIAGALDIVQGLAVGAAGPYAPVAASVFGLLAVGLGVDNRRKDGVIQGQKQIAKATGVPSA